MRLTKFAALAAAGSLTLAACGGDRPNAGRSAGGDAGGDALPSPEARGGSVTGIEISAEAVASAQRTVAEYGLEGVDFSAQDAPEFAVSSGAVPQMLVVAMPSR